MHCKKSTNYNGKCCTDVSKDELVAKQEKTFEKLSDIKIKYQIIYADPPWKYGGSGGTKWSRANEYYPTMSFDELKNMKDDILSIADDENCLLFLWVVSPELKRCLEIGEAWGFKYITVAFVWYKERANVGNYTMPQCELCLLFKRGKIPPDRVRNPGQKQFISEPITIHSKKASVCKRTY